MNHDLVTHYVLTASEQELAEMTQLADTTVNILRRRVGVCHLILSVVFAERNLPSSDYYVTGHLLNSRSDQSWLTAARCSDIRRSWSGNHACAKLVIAVGKYDSSNVNHSRVFQDLCSARAEITQVFGSVEFSLL